MTRALCTTLGFCAALSAAAELANAQPTTLTADQLDAVTAGTVQVDVANTAVATGSFAHTATNGAAGAASSKGPLPGIQSHVGAAAGTASAVGDVSTDTSVSATGSASGTFVVSESQSWTVNVQSGELSGGFIWVSGRTGVFLLGGP